MISKLISGNSYLLLSNELSHSTLYGFYIKINIAQALAVKSEKQIIIKTTDNKYIHAKLLRINLKTTTLR